MRALDNKAELLVRFGHVGVEAITVKEKDFYTINEAARFLGVSPNTLRNWDKAGKFKAKRHPMSRYRVYSKSALEKLLKKIREGL